MDDGRKTGERGGNMENMGVMGVWKGRKRIFFFLFFFLGRMVE